MEILSYQDALVDYKETNDIYAEEITHIDKEPTYSDIFDQPIARCSFCNVGMTSVHSIQDSIIEGNIVNHYVYVCKLCGWWNISRQVDMYSARSVKTEIRVTRGILKYFDAADNNLPINVLNETILKNPRVINHISPNKLEELVKWIFESYYKCKVIHTGKSHDGGIDLVIVESDNPIAIQIKRRKNYDSVEPVSIVREFLGAMVSKNFKKGIFVSTADRFSYDAIKLSNGLITNRIINSYELIDFDKFISIFRLTEKPTIYPWIRYSDEQYRIEIQNNDPFS